MKSGDLHVVNLLDSFSVTTINYLILLNTNYYYLILETLALADPKLQWAHIWTWVMILLFFLFFQFSKGKVPWGWPSSEVTVWCNDTQVTMSWAIVQKVITPLSTNPSLNAEVGFNPAKWKVASQADICPKQSTQSYFRQPERYENATSKAKLSGMFSCRIGSRDS